MGATTSGSSTSPSMPTACVLFEPKESVTCLFVVPEYSKWARMHAGTALNYDPFFVGGLGYSLNVYPAGFDEESADYVAVFLTAHHSFKYYPEGTCRMLFEILDDTGERAVFHNSTAGLGQETLDVEDYPRSSRGYVRFVKSSEMEASSCVRRDNSVVVRCTVSKYEQIIKRPAEVFAAETTALSSPRRASKEDRRSFGTRRRERKMSFGQ